MYFFTLVTEGHQPILPTDFGRSCLAIAMRETLAKRPITVDAMMLLPDHMHAIWTLPENDADFSIRWLLIKRRFVKLWLASGGAEQPRSDSRIANARRGVWQRRFWEHAVRADEFGDIAAYIHINPVKHGLAKCPHEWPWSSFHRWVRDGQLRSDWQCVCDGTCPEPTTFGSFAGCEGE
jgi:putative transposase